MVIVAPDPLMSAYPPPPRSFFSALRYCRNPLLVRHHFVERTNRKAFVAAITGKAANVVQQAIDEIEQDYDFHRLIMGKRKQVLGKAPHGTDWMYLTEEWESQYFPFFIHYSMVRLLKPEIVVEKGGKPGSSSAFMLRAMERNGMGKLITLDLSNLGMTDEIRTEPEKIWYSHMPKDQSSGWMVPERLNSRHEQVFGDVRETLPGVMARYPQIDIFVQDSDHVNERIMWEYKQAWPNIKAGGVLYSDDVSLHSIFDDFAREVRLPTIRYDNFGAIQKPAASSTSKG